MKFKFKLIIIYLTLFVNRAQSGYLKNLKENLSENELYHAFGYCRKLFILCTGFCPGIPLGQQPMHPLSICIRAKNKDGTEVTKCIYICIISDCLKHDTVAVHAFLKNSKLKKVISVTDQQPNTKTIKKIHKSYEA